MRHFGKRSLRNWIRIDDVHPALCSYCHFESALYKCFIEWLVHLLIECEKHFDARELLVFIRLLWSVAKQQ